MLIWKWRMRRYSFLAHCSPLALLLCALHLWCLHFSKYSNFFSVNWALWSPTDLHVQTFLSSALSPPAVLHLPFLLVSKPSCSHCFSPTNLHCSTCHTMLSMPTMLVVSKNAMNVSMWVSISATPLFLNTLKSCWQQLCLVPQSALKAD